MADIYKDFSGRDYTARFEAFLARWKQEVPELTDFNHSDAGVAEGRLLCREVDQLNFYLDHAFAEGFVPTARFMQSLIDLTTLTDYPPKLMSAATTTVRLTREGTFDGLVSIPKWTAFSRSDGLTYLTTADVLLQPATTYIDVPVIQGTLKTLTLQPEDFAVIDLSLRPKYNTGTGIAAGSVSVVNSDLGLAWTEVDSFWRSSSTDRHFLLQLYADKWEGVANTVFLVLGNGTKGAGAPDVPVTVQFLVTDGASGNCGSGVITQVPEDLDDYITVTNPTGTTGGASSETIEAYRARIPEVTRAQRRAVNITDDYPALIEAIPGVACCQAADRNYDAKWPHMYVVLFVVPEGGGAMSDTLKNSIYDVCTQYGHLLSWRERYILLDATQVPVNVACRIKVDDGYVASAVSSTVYTTISNLFDLSNLGIGDSLSFSALNLAVGRIAGVSWVEFDAPRENVDAGMGEILIPGTITVTVVA